MKDLSPSYPTDDAKTGLYIHVPFCKSRCRYCGFVTSIAQGTEQERYLRSVTREIHLWGKAIEEGLFLVNREVDTIYFGGGTPSLLLPQDVGRLLAACRAAFRVSDTSEVTLEINPSTADREAWRMFRDAGINRASLGVQSFHDAELKAMGRRHSADDALRAFEDLRSAGFDNVSMDIMAGFPGQTRDSLATTLDGTLELQPEHISVYLLEVKELTPLDLDIRAGIIPVPDEDLSADMYEDVCARCSASGYEHYEIANFARKGRASRHNLKYWQDEVYLGFGPAAHGMTGRHRYANLENLIDYERAVAQGRLPMSKLTPLSPLARFKDALIMGMRLCRGMDLDELGERYQTDARAYVTDSVEDLLDSGLLTLTGSRLAFTARGRLLSNVVFCRWV